MSGVSVSQSFVAQKQRQADRCHRCGGLMVPEKVFEIGSIDWHCVSCGERIDPVILAHRHVHPQEGFACEEAKKLSVEHGKRRLN
ncbi:MAG: hypothetical protein HP496_08610 [Nitrospira sp.]|nr:hypothetical protein [Nitrospira sp.]